MSEDTLDKLVRFLEMSQYDKAKAFIKIFDHRGEDAVANIFSLVETDEYASALTKLYDYLGLPEENDEWNEDDFVEGDEEYDGEYPRRRKYYEEDGQPHYKSPDQSPHYNEGLDLDQQSPEFWDDISTPTY